MAGADYFCCDVCGERMFYDANIDYEDCQERIGRLVGICTNCSKTHRISVTKGSNKINILPKFFEQFFKSNKNEYKETL